MQYCLWTAFTCLTCSDYILCLAVTGPQHLKTDCFCRDGRCVKCSKFNSAARITWVIICCLSVSAKHSFFFFFVFEWWDSKDLNKDNKIHGLIEGERERNLSLQKLWYVLKIHGVLLRQSTSNSLLPSLSLRHKSVSLIQLTKSEKLPSHWHLFMHNLHTSSKRYFYISFTFSYTDEKDALCTIWCKQTQKTKQTTVPSRFLSKEWWVSKASTAHELCFLFIPVLPFFVSTFLMWSQPTS